MVAAPRAVLDAQLLRVGKRILQQRFEAFDGHTAMLVTRAETPEELYARASGARRAPDDGAADLGRMLVRVERAVRSIGHIGRVHVCRWQDGSEHLHWWFMARPVRLPQVRGTFAAVWDDVLPPLPEDVWRRNVDAFVAAL